MLAVFTAIAADAADLFVDLNCGKDGNPGNRTAPLKSFQAAMVKARPGDTVFLLPTGRPINTSLIIRNKQGLPGQPIAINGSFNTLIGSRPVDLNSWREVKPDSGLYRRELKVVPTGNRFFMSFNGKMERMGRHTKWKGAALKKPEELQDYQWTLTGTKEAWFKIPVGMKPTAAQVEEPWFTSGVEMSGKCAYITIRNLIVRRFWNDGYNIHNNCRDIRFENIAAVENSDDGISAHETCKIKVKNMISIGNGTGFCHIQQAECEHENIYIAESDSRDIFLENSSNTLKNIAVDGTAPGNLEIRPGQETLDNCFFFNRHPDVKLLLGQSQALKTGNVSVSGYVTESVLPEGVAVADSPADLRHLIEEIKIQLFKIFDNNLQLVKVK